MRTTVFRRSSIRILLSGTSGFSRPWRCRAARSVPPNSGAIFTGMPRSLPRPIPPAREAHEDPRLGLAAEMLRGQGSVHLRVWGTSMLPSVWPGDMLTIQSLAHDEIVPGDIVLVQRDRRFFIHRLVEKRQAQDCTSWITRGDAMPDDDPPAAAFELLGRVTCIRRGNRSFVPSRRVSLIHLAMARVLCRWGRVRGLALNIHAARLQAGASHS